MKFYKLALWKHYFDFGYAATSYLKYLIALFGLSSLNVKLTLIIGLIYGCSCFVIGKLAYSYGFVAATHEVQNNVNPFVHAMLKKRKL